MAAWLDMSHSCPFKQSSDVRQFQQFGARGAGRGKMVCKRNKSTKEHRLLVLPARGRFAFERSIEPVIGLQRQENCLRGTTKQRWRYIRVQGSRESYPPAAYSRTRVVSSCCLVEPGNKGGGDTLRKFSSYFLELQILRGKGKVVDAEEFGDILVMRSDRGSDPGKVMI